MESFVSKRIKDVLLKYPAPPVWNERHGDMNMACVLSQHLRSAWKLPDGHPVRKLFAAATVEGYLRCEKPKFHQEIREIHGFATDLLDEANKVIGSLETPWNESCAYFREPISGIRLKFVKGPRGKN